MIRSTVNKSTEKYIAKMVNVHLFKYIQFTFKLETKQEKEAQFITNDQLILHCVWEDEGIASTHAETCVARKGHVESCDRIKRGGIRSQLQD